MTQITTEKELTLECQRRRYKKAAELLIRWMNEEGDYDEQTWPQLEVELNDSALRCEEPHEPGS